MPPTLLTLSVLNVSNGAKPIGDLISDAAGDLFGTTSEGGANADGTVFELPKTGSGYGTLTTPPGLPQPRVGS